VRTGIAQAFIAIVCLGLPMCADLASAQSRYSLTVSRHRGVPLSEDDVDKILDDASKILQKNSCDVTFKRNGSVRLFASRDTPKIITDEEDRDAVHQERADVKVVEKIKFCRPELGFQAFDGCSWPPRMGRRSMIVVQNPAEPFPNIGRLWAHEFGHRTGLRHRSEPLALMTGCKFLRNPLVQVRQDECNCFLEGPGSCVREDPLDLHCDQ
jgi:hypothetical protein